MIWSGLTTIDAGLVTPGGGGSGKNELFFGLFGVVGVFLQIPIGMTSVLRWLKWFL